MVINKISNVQTLSCTNEFEVLRQALQSRERLGMISSIDAIEERMKITREERKYQRTFVEAKHIKLDGKPRSITKHEPTEKNPKLFWYTKMSDGSKMYGNSEDDLYNNLFIFYSGSSPRKHDYSIDATFKRALEKKSNGNISEETISRYDSDYRRFISSEFSKKDIRFITAEDLEDYTNDMVKRIHPISTAFRGYKSLLNLIFKYALYHDKVIKSNIVETIDKSNYLLQFGVTNKKINPDNPDDSLFFSVSEIELIKSVLWKEIADKSWTNCYALDFMILFAIETGARIGEMCSLKWNDIYWNDKEPFIHIHSQQIIHRTTKKKSKSYEYIPWTKNEHRKDPAKRFGRKFPLTDNLKQVLIYLRNTQNTLNIQSEYIFCDENGKWILSERYQKYLRKFCTSLGLSATHNHCFRKSLNSNVFIPLGMPVTDRAKLLGHSVEVNLKHYSFGQKDNLGSLCDMLNSKNLGNPL